MQAFSSRTDKTSASLLRSVQRQAQANLKALQTARDRLQTLLARPEAASFLQEIHASLKQINGWITTAQSFSRHLEKEIARLPELGRTKKQTIPPIVSTGSGAQVTHTNAGRGGSLTGKPAAELEKKSREQYAQKLERATAWVRKQRQNGSPLTDAELSKQAARNIFGSETHAGAIAKALTAGGGVQGAKGGTRASAEANAAGAMAINFDFSSFARRLVTGAVSSKEFEQLVRNQWQQGDYMVNLPGDLAKSVIRMTTTGKSLHYADPTFSNTLIFGSQGKSAGNLVQSPADLSALARRNFSDFMRPPHLHQWSRIGLVVEGNSFFTGLSTSQHLFLCGMICLWAVALCAEHGLANCHLCF